MDYMKCKQKFLRIARLSDENELDEALPGRLKYDPRTLRALPFEGISVTHSIDPETANAVRLSPMANEIISRLKDADLGTKVAFVSRESFHATTFDLINEKEHSQKLARAGYDYATVRRCLEAATIRFLDKSGLRLAATVRITGIGMFCPKVLKLDLQFHEVVSKAFQTFRLGLHRYLVENVAGYSAIRPPDWNKKLAGHITFGYVVNPMAEQEVDSFLAILREFND